MPDDVLNGILDSASDDQSANSTGRTPLVIDSDLRTIKVPTDYVFGVQNDQDVLAVPFVVPRYCDGVDLSELSIRINFTTKSGLSSYYDVTDKTVNTDTIEFTWLLGAAVFVSVGDLTFAVCIRKVEADGRITKEFNTTLATAKILPGLTVEDQKDPTQYSILVQMQSLADRVNATIEDAEDYAEQLRNYVGAPLVATAASDMTDQNRIYVYVGNENGYNNGHWYYYQSLTWHDGGTYSALPAGDYPDIYAGNVMSDRYQTDQTPYLLRKTASELGSSRIGQRCYPVLVGASVAENQLVNMPDGTRTISGITTVRSDGVKISYSGTSTETGTYIDAYAYIDTDSFLMQFIAGHRYLIRAISSDNKLFIVVNRPYTDMTSNNKRELIYTPSATPSYFYVRVLANNGEAVNGNGYLQIIDITAMLGSSIADYIYTLEQATAGSGIAWLRSYGFLNGYKAHNSGSIESVEVTEKVVTGFNQWDEETEVGMINVNTGINQSDAGCFRCKNYIPVIPNATYYLKGDSLGTNVRFVFYDAEKKFVSSPPSIVNQTFTIPQNVYYFRFYERVTPTVYNHDICINLSSDRNGEYEPYTTTSYPLGSDVLNGIFKLDASNNLYAYGDMKTSDGVITRKMILVDLGTLDWTINSSPSTHVFRTALNDAKMASEEQNMQRDPVNAIMSNGFIVKGYTPITSNDNGYFAIGFAPDGETRYVVVAHDYDNVSDFTQAMSGVMLVYEAATPTTEQSTPFVSAQTVYPDGTEEFVTENGVPVGHVTKYPYDLKTQAERLIDIPDVPSTNGTYVLKATRSSSGINYTWVTG